MKTIFLNRKQHDQYLNHNGINVIAFMVKRYKRSWSLQGITFYNVSIEDQKLFN